MHTPGNRTDVAFSCVLCGSSRNEIVVKGIKSHCGRIEERFDFRRCLDCAFVSLWPRPSESELQRYYRFIQGESENSLDSVGTSSRGSSPENRCSGVSSPSHIWKYCRGLKSIWNWFTQPSFHAIRQYIAAGPPKSHVLDVGCGRGALMAYIADLASCVEGFDFDAAAVMQCRRRGYKAQVADLNTLTPTEKRFDFIVMRHVLEHIADPVAVLSNLRVGLRPNGRLILEVPNVNGFTSKLFKSNWNGWDPPFHLNQFSKETLTRVLLDAGYCISTITTLATVDEFRRSFNLYLGGADNKHSLIRMSLVPFYLALQACGAGGALLVQATARDGH